MRDSLTALTGFLIMAAPCVVLIGVMLT